MKRSFIYLLGVCAVLVLMYFTLIRPSDWKELNADEFQKARSNSTQSVLVDVREPAELLDGIIPGAINIPVGQLAARIDEVPKGKPVLIYCRSGRRSQTAADIFVKNGYLDVSHLKGGINAWTGPIVRDGGSNRPAP